MSGALLTVSPEGASRKPTIVTVALVMLALAAGAGWWIFPRSDAGAAASDAANLPASVAAADGSIMLTAAQLRAQGIETAAVDAATQLPVPGLPAQAMAPLAASAQVTTPYAGVVTHILVDEGAWVRQGQPLARIQSRDLLAAQGELARAHSDATAAALQARRDAALLAEGIIPTARNEQSQARTRAAQSALRQANGALARLRPVAGGQVGEYDILAPMAGQIVRRHLTLGKSVAALDGAFVVAEAGRMDVHFSAPLRLRSAITRGLPVRLPDGSTARVAAVGAAADPSSQSLSVRASLETEPGSTSYTIGQQFSVSLLLAVPEGALAVPPSALLPAGKGQVLYVLERDTSAAGGQGAGRNAAKGAARIRAVSVQWLGGDETVSVVAPASDREKLAAGAQVVTRGTALLKSIIPLQ